MRAFVTGATGFIGGALARMLRAQGHDVTALVRTPSKAGALADAGVAIAPGDVCDREALRAVAGHDVVFHFAALYAFGTGDLDAMNRVNVSATTDVVRAAADAGVPRIVYCSSTQVFGVRRHDAGAADETTEHEGPFTSFYERTKWVAHRRVRALAREGAPVVTVMPAGVYGPGDTSLMGRMWGIYARGLLIAVPHTAISWVHVDDVATGAIAAATAEPGEEFILGGDNDTIVGALRRISPLTGIAPPRATVPGWTMRLLEPAGPLVAGFLGQSRGFLAEVRRTMAGNLTASSSKAERMLGYAWRPVEEGMPPMVAAIRGH